MVAKLDDIFDRADGVQSWWAVVVAWLQNMEGLLTFDKFVSANNVTS